MRNLIDLVNRRMSLSDVAADVLLAPYGMSHKDLKPSPGENVRELSVRKEFYDDWPEWRKDREPLPRSECFACHRPIFTSEDGYTHKGIVKLQRGSFAISDTTGTFTTDPHDNENIKFERFMCEQCWLTDPDLCRFFNKIAMRVR